jgi:hypothetical protein
VVVKWPGNSRVLYSDPMFKNKKNRARVLGLRFVVWGLGFRV